MVFYLCSIAIVRSDFKGACFSKFHFHNTLKITQLQRVFFSEKGREKRKRKRKRKRKKEGRKKRILKDDESRYLIPSFDD